MYCSTRQDGNGGVLLYLATWGERGLGGGGLLRYLVRGVRAVMSSRGTKTAVPG